MKRREFVKYAFEGVAIMAGGTYAAYLIQKRREEEDFSKRLEEERQYMKNNVSVNIEGCFLHEGDGKYNYSRASGSLLNLEDASTALDEARSEFGENYFKTTISGVHTEEIKSNWWKGGPEYKYNKNTFMDVPGDYFPFLLLTTVNNSGDERIDFKIKEEMVISGHPDVGKTKGPFRTVELNPNETKNVFFPMIVRGRPIDRNIDFAFHHSMVNDDGYEGPLILKRVGARIPCEWEKLR